MGSGRKDEDDGQTIGKLARSVNKVVSGGSQLGPGELSREASPSASEIREVEPLRDGSVVLLAGDGEWVGSDENDGRAGCTNSRSVVICSRSTAIRSVPMDSPTVSRVRPGRPRPLSNWLRHHAPKASSLPRGIHWYPSGAGISYGAAHLTNHSTD